MDQVPASEELKDRLENQAIFLLGPSDSTTVAAIITKKFLTDDNQFVFLTRTAVTTASIPSLKVQVFRRVEGGVHETGYLLYTDHRFERYDNAMIFGQDSPDQSLKNTPVSQDEADKLLELLSSLGPQNQRI